MRADSFAAEYVLLAFEQKINKKKIKINFRFFFFVRCSLVQRLLDDFIESQLYFGHKEWFNSTRKNCVWRDVAKHRRLCPKEVAMELFSNGQQETVSSFEFCVKSNCELWWMNLELFSRTLWIVIRYYYRCDINFARHNVLYICIYARKKKLMWRSTC